eukprot:scaffold6511_cov112-Isochrysis_galbana.AAC.3
MAAAGAKKRSAFGGRGVVWGWAHIDVSTTDTRLHRCIESAPADAQPHGARLVACRRRLGRPLRPVLHRPLVKPVAVGHWFGRGGGSEHCTVP